MRRLALAVSVATVFGLNLLSAPSEANACWGRRFARCCRPRPACYVCAPCVERAEARAVTERALGSVQIVNLQDFGILLIRDGNMYKYIGKGPIPTAKDNASDWNKVWERVAIPPSP